MIDEASAQEASDARGATQPRVAVWLAIVALIVTIVLVIPFLAPRNALVVPIFVLAFASAIAGLVLGLRARRAAVGARRIGAWALMCAAAALVIDAVLLVVVLAVLVFTAPTAVELRGSGPDGIEVTFSNELETRTLTWPSVGRAEFNTEGDWAEITVTAPTDAPDRTVNCQIDWNGETVIDETSASGTVACRYEAG